MDNKEQDRCRICLESFDIERDSKKLVSPCDCKVKFHKECIQKWVDYKKLNRCEVCRAIFARKEPQDPPVSAYIIHGGILSLLYIKFLFLFSLFLFLLIGVGNLDNELIETKNDKCDSMCFFGRFTVNLGILNLLITIVLILIACAYLFNSEIYKKIFGRYSKYHIFKANINLIINIMYALLAHLLNTIMLLILDKTVIFNITNLLSGHGIIFYMQFMITVLVSISYVGKLIYKHYIAE